jgi:hypothetical protein
MLVMGVREKDFLSNRNLNDKRIGLMLCFRK